MARTIKIVKHSKVHGSTKVLTKKNLEVPVNVKVAGERTMLKRVVLVRHPQRTDVVMVRTGGRGRPRNIPVEQIERVRVL